jgi:hypothetical protein
MDYFQGVVAEYLRADRAVFINTECLIQLHEGDAPAKGTHWYCDIVAVNFREKRVYLCEVTYSTTLNALLTRLRAWNSQWPALCDALKRDCKVPEGWEVIPWVFIPRRGRPRLRAKLAELNLPVSAISAPRVTCLERVVPWKYQSWNRRATALEPLASGKAIMLSDEQPT